MGRHYTAADFPAPEHVRPRIRRVVPLGQAVAFIWRCAHSPSGSMGYGASPLHAYARWLKNYQRRRKFYCDREKLARESLAWRETHMRRVK